MGRPSPYKINHIRSKFERYFSEWLEETKRHKFSSLAEAYLENEPYRKIIAMKYDALPYIIEKLDEGYFLLNKSILQITGLKLTDIAEKKLIPLSEQEISKLLIKWWKRNHQRFMVP